MPQTNQIIQTPNYFTNQNFSNQNFSNQNLTHQNYSNQNVTHQNYSNQNVTHQNYSNQSCQIMSNRPLQEVSNQPLPQADTQPIVDKEIINNILGKNGMYTLVTRDQILANQRIVQNQIFKSYADFKLEFEIYCRETSQIFVISKCYLLKLDNTEKGESDHDDDDEDNDDGEGEIVEENEDNEKNYKSCKFVCIRHSLRKKTTSSKPEERQQLRYNGCNCKTYILINRQKRGPNRGLYKVTRLRIEHNHTINQEFWYLHHTQRKVPDALKQNALDMLSVNAKPALVCILNVYYFFQFSDFNVLFYLKDSRTH